MANHRDEEAVASEAPFLPDEVVREILLLLPVADVMRNRIVCKQWRVIVEEGSFGHEYAKRRSPSVLVFFRRDFNPGEPEPEPKAGVFTARVELHGLDLAARETHELLRFNDVAAEGSLEWESIFEIEGCCDGIILFSLRGLLFACNPFAHRWASLPPIHLNHGIVGFYSYSPPGVVGTEYRVLYRENSGSSYLIMNLSTDDVRGVAPMLNRPPELGVLWSDLGLRAHGDPPVVIGHTLHWRPQKAEDPDNNIILFDCAAEEFLWIPPPSDKNGCRGGHLLEINSSLAMAATDIQKDHEFHVWVFCNKAWSKRYNIVLPQAEIATLSFLMDEFYNTPVFVLNLQKTGHHVIVQCLHYLLHCNDNGIVLERHSSDHQDSLVFITRHTLHESVAGLAFLPEDCISGKPPFSFSIKTTP